MLDTGSGEVGSEEAVSSDGGGLSRGDRNEAEEHI